MVMPTQYDPNYIPQRGDVVQISFDPQQRGFEMQKRRPALVLSPKIFNSVRNAVIVCPITHTEREIDYEVEIPKGQKVNGFIRADQVMSLNWQERNAVLFDELPYATVDEAAEVVQYVVWDMKENDPDYLPVRGDLVEIEGKLEKRETALVLSASEFNYWQRLFVICPIVDPDDEGALSNKFSVEIPNGHDITGVILADQVRSWDWWAREAKDLGYLPEKTVDIVSAKVETIIWGE